MALAWPATLPSKVDESGYTESPPNNTIQTETSIGPPKFRRRTTANVRPLTVTMWLTMAQVEILDGFYHSDLSSGALTFNFDHPRTGVTKEMQFSAPPVYSDPNGDYMLATMQWLVLP